MKRYISLALAAAVLVFSLAVPSYAAENTWIDVLDYSTPNDSGSYLVNYTPGDWVHFDFPESHVSYIDMVVEFQSPGSPSCSVVYSVFTQLERVKLNDYVYRFYGSLDQINTAGIDLSFSGVPGETIQFLSLKISSTAYMLYDSPVSGLVSYGGGDEKTFYYNSYDDYTGVVLPGSSDWNYQDYTIYLRFPSWKKYDYLDIQFYASHLSVLSLAGTLDGVSVPYAVSYLDAYSTMDYYLVNVQLDLTSVNRVSDGLLELVITGSVPTIDTSVGYFVVMYANGLIEIASPSGDLSFWSRIKSFFTDRFSALNVWIDNQTSSITGVIAQWGQKIVDAINPDTGAADDAIEEGSQAADQVTDLTDQMNNVAKPDLSAGGDISAIISPGDMASYTVFLSTVVNAPYIGQVVMLSLILSLAGYVLFGKR